MGSITKDSSKPLPLVLVAPRPEAGHMSPMLTIAHHLKRRGFPALFLCEPQFTDQVRAAGLEPYETPSIASITADFLAAVAASPDATAEEHRQLIYKYLFIEATPTRTGALLRALEEAHEKIAVPEGRDVVVLVDSLYYGQVPLWLGAPLPRGYAHLPRIVAFHPTPMMLDGDAETDEWAPFANLVPFDASPEGRARNRALWAAQRQSTEELMRYANEAWARLGAVRKASGIFNVGLSSADVTLLAYGPGLELPLSKLPAPCKYAGMPPVRRIDSSDGFAGKPSWWADVLSAREQSRRVILLTQGTFNVVHERLLIPALKAFASLGDDVLVLALLGKHGTQLPADISVPTNARVADYIPYEAILPLADVFVFNGGFGGLKTAIMLGVPTVIAGTTEDKSEVASRAERAGVAVNLKTDTPSEEVIREGVLRVFGDPSFKEKAEMLKRESEEIDFFKTLEEALLGHSI